MKFITAFGFLFFFSFGSFAQNSNPQVKAALGNTEFAAAGAWIPGKTVDNYIKGSQYLFPNWAGQYTLILKDKSTAKVFNLNYNLSSKKLEAMIAKDSVFQYDLAQFDYIIKSGNSYKVITENNINGLFLELYKDKNIVFYKEEVIGINEEVVNPLTNEPISAKAYVKKNLYYLFINNKLEEIKLNKSDVLKYLKSKEKLVKNYVWDNNLTYSSEEDVIRILTYYNSIQ